MISALPATPAEPGRRACGQGSAATLIAMPSLAEILAELEVTELEEAGWAMAENPESSIVSLLA